MLDEIEAALDEVNVSRYARYLKNLSDHTQFIAITHRRGTMEEADIMYGVTMPGEGGIQAFGAGYQPGGEPIGNEIIIKFKEAGVWDFLTRLPKG